jgi:signal transduction histidine kinase
VAGPRRARRLHGAAAQQRPGAGLSDAVHGQGRRGAVHAGLGRPFAMDRREYLVINARDVSAAEHTRLEREAILETASIGIAVTRDSASCWPTPPSSDVPLAAWRPAGSAGRRGVAGGQRPPRTRRAYGPALAAGEQVEFERTARRRDGSSFIARVLAKAIDPRHATRGGTIWIVEDVTERRDVRARAGPRARRGRAANRAKSAFLANTSHELRTPLHGMLGLADLAPQPGLDEATRRQYLDQISESAQTLTGIIADILDLSKIEAGKLQIERPASTSASCCARCTAPT